MFSEHTKQQIAVGSEISRSTLNNFIDDLVDIEIITFKNSKFSLNPKSKIVKGLMEISTSTGIPYIITTDSHYKSKEERNIHKAFLNSQDGDREVDAFYASTYMMDTQELESYFPYFNKEILDNAYETIHEIEEKC